MARRAWEHNDQGRRAPDGELPRPTATAYIAAQVGGAIVGVWAAHLMFELPLWQLSITARTGPGQWLAGASVTFGLLLTIFGRLARTPAAVPFAVGLYITAAYWFTASTSFANPAVTMARAFSGTFAGIAPAESSPLSSTPRRHGLGRRSRAVTLAGQEKSRRRNAGVGLRTRITNTT